MRDRGELHVMGDRVVPLDDLMRLAVERFGQPVSVCADRWREGEADESMGRIDELVEVPLSLRGQGFHDGSADLRSFRTALLSGEVTPVKSLLLRAAMSEARAITDAAGNSKICKSGEGGRRRRARDDAACAAILAVSEGRREAAEPEETGWVNVQ